MFAKRKKFNSSGFTLIELLVVISIIAILSVIGLVIFTGVQNRTKDSKKRADIDAISKAYEGNFATQNAYQALTGTEFSGGIIPKPPEGGDYNCVEGPTNGCATNSNERFKICANLESGIYCRSSTQGSSGAGGADSFGVCAGALTSGLVAYWKMDTISGGTTPDSSVNNNTGIVSGATVLPGKVGNAASFNGGAYIRANPTVSSSFTVAMWVNSSGNPGTSFFWEGQDTSAPSVEGSDGNYSFWMNDTNHIGTGAITTGTWYLITATYDASTQTQKLYVNDSLRGTNSSVNGDNMTTFYLGARAGNNLFYRGLIDEVTIHNRALSSNEILSLYNESQGCSVI